jgi:hypothetical protein
MDQNNHFLPNLGNIPNKILLLDNGCMQAALKAGVTNRDDQIWAIESVRLLFVERSREAESEFVTYVLKISRLPNPTEEYFAQRTV